MRKSILSLIILFTSGCVFGCAGIDVPTPETVLKNPTGSGSLHVGMTKQEVLSLYDEPDFTRTVYSDEWKEPRKEWFYSGRYPSLPVNAGYLSKDLYLYFDHDNLTNISNKSLGSEEKPVSEDEYIK